jgi:hypothetical protein
MSSLTGPSGVQIRTGSATGAGVYNWVNREIELFYVRYLQIRGLSLLSYETYDERHIPARFRRPHNSSGIGTGTWADRPDRDKFYPDIGVPIEWVNTFAVTQGQNQSVWVDVYVPKSATTGIHRGSITIAQNGSTIGTIPVELDVKTFTLPDMPTAKSMLFFGYPDVAQRYTGVQYPNANTTQDVNNRLVRDRHFLLAHRHKISLIDSNSGATVSPGNRPRDEWIPRLSGALFTAANGYDGPGVNTSNNIFSIGTYGTWGWQAGGEAGMRTATDQWETWFATNSPSTERFLYLIDESTNYPQIEQWSAWMLANPGPGRNLKSFATLNLPAAMTNVPSLDIAASWFTVGDTNTWTNALAASKANPRKRFYLYNGKRPSNGSFATEDDGVALRELVWAQTKKGVDRWFFWEGTYYNDFQSGRGQTNVFQNAQTFGALSGPNTVLGNTGWNHSNGDGVLFYPGTDTLFPTDSYGVLGPIASLRMKHWRRGIQDADYIALANAVNPTAAQSVVNRMVPQAMWDYGVASQTDPTWIRTDISWSVNPNDWENARKDLSDIIEGRPLNFSQRAPERKSTILSSIRRPFEAIRQFFSGIKKNIQDRK